MKKVLALLAFVFSLNSQAAIITYDFSFANEQNVVFLVGSFTAQDLNNDNYIRDSEVISFDLEGLGIQTFGLTPTNGVNFNFNFDILAQLFLLGGCTSSDSGQLWNHSTGAVGLGVQAGCGSIGLELDGVWQGPQQYNATLVIQTVQLVNSTNASVPAPATFGLLMLGSMFLVFRNKIK